MDFAIEKYIKQTFENPIYSPIIWIQARDLGPGSIINFEFSNQDVKLILVHQIVISTSSTWGGGGGGGPITFLDQYDKNLFTLIQDNCAINGVHNLKMTVTGSRLKLVTGSANTDIQFSVAVQTVSEAYIKS